MEYRQLSPKDFYEKVSNDCGVSVETIEKVLRSYVDLIIEELIVYNVVQIPLIGRMTSKPMRKYTVLPTGETKRITEGKRRLSVRFTDAFKNQVSGLDTTLAHKIKMRERLRQIALKDKELERQAEIKKKKQINYEYLLSRKREGWAKKHRYATRNSGEEKITKSKGEVDYGEE